MRDYDFPENVAVLLKLQENEIFLISEVSGLYRFSDKVLEVNSDVYSERWSMADSETFFNVMTGKYSVLRFPTVETSIDVVINKYCKPMKRKRQIIKVEEYVRTHYHDDMCLNSLKTACLILMENNFKNKNEMTTNELLYISETFFGTKNIKITAEPLLYVIDKEIAARKLNSWCKKE